MGGGGEEMGTLPEINNSHLKMDGLKMKLPFGMASWQLCELLVSGSVLFHFVIKQNPVPGEHGEQLWFLWDLGGMRN